MINFERFELSNGLKVIVHEDRSTPLAALNILYDVGARDEDPTKTGFAHLFEHLMFGGSVNIPNYDAPLQKAGGENNAFTTNDITNYYLTIPSHNIETAFWLESDRMLGLAFSPKNLEVQRNVVIEEFKERYLNEPYGDVWLLLRPLAYRVHPYLWSTIGKDISHIENITLEDTKKFFKKYYLPNNAILVVAGNIDFKKIKELSDKWFSSIPAGEANNRSLPMEPIQTHSRELSVERDVPFDAIYKVYHSSPRKDKNFYTEDLITDILSRGVSSRLYNNLVKRKKLFSEIHCYVTAELDGGLIVVEGKLIKGVEMKNAEKAILEEIEKLRSEKVSDYELKKVINKIESTLRFAEVSILNRARSLAYSELLGDASYVNKELENYFSVTQEKILERANNIFSPNNCSTLYYFSKQ